MSYIPPIPKQQVASQAAYDAMRFKLRRVASYQRWVLLALLVNVCFAAIVVASEFELVEFPSNVRYTFGLIRFPVCIFMSVALFLLAKELWGWSVAIVCAVLMWIPLIRAITSLLAFILLFAVNQKATRFLQNWGVKVGLLGANPGRV